MSRKWAIHISSLCRLRNIPLTEAGAIRLPDVLHRQAALVRTDDFKYFIDCCHRNGIGVIMDWVPARYEGQNGLARFDGTALYEHEDWRKGEHKEWGGCVFNYSRNEVSNFLIANALFWIKEYHLDGAAC